MHRREPVPIVVGGQTYRVMASVPDDSLHRLAGVVDEHVRALSQPGRPPPPTAILLAAISLAHDLEQERAGRRALEVRGRDLVRRLMARVDEALEEDSPDAAHSTGDDPLDPEEDAAIPCGHDDGEHDQEG